MQYQFVLNSDKKSVIIGKETKLEHFIRCDGAYIRVENNTVSLVDLPTLLDRYMKVYIEDVKTIKVCCWHQLAIVSSSFTRQEQNILYR